MRTGVRLLPEASARPSSHDDHSPSVAKRLRLRRGPLPRPHPVQSDSDGNRLSHRGGDSLGSDGRAAELSAERHWLGPQRGSIVRQIELFGAVRTHILTGTGRLNMAVPRAPPGIVSTVPVQSPAPRAHAWEHRDDFNRVNDCWAPAPSFCPRREREGVPCRLPGRERL